MKTPICDFARRYAQHNALRLHMPGHKGNGPIGAEPLDITEIDGADSLYEAAGIIRESEDNAGRLFGSRTFYSTEGSSLCIRAMLYLAALYAKQKGKRFLVAAGRNAHKTFLSAAALLDFNIMWLCPDHQDSYLSCKLNAAVLDDLLSCAAEKPTAVYLTSPDYLGNITELSSIAKVCRRHEVLLLVDNAHGAYLRFLPESRHPIDLGADICCDSAHKTLPVLTGGAYLHISSSAPSVFSEQAKNAMALFGSTSPSYLTLQSLDAANAYLAEDYCFLLHRFLPLVYSFKERLKEHGYFLIGDEPLKVTLATKPYGYDGKAFANLLRKKNIVCEFADPDYTVMMLTPEIGLAGLNRLEDAVLSIPQKRPLTERPPVFHLPERVMSVREAILSSCESIPVSESIGRVLAAVSVSCPPAVPVIVSGERIDAETLRCFSYYKVTSCTVIQKKNT